MASFKKYDAVCTIGKYTDRQGNEKKRYVNVGSVFEDEQGRLSLKMDVIPVGLEWSGWISMYEPKAKDASPVTEHSEAKGNAFQPQSDDDIPF